MTVDQSAWIKACDTEDNQIIFNVQIIPVKGIGDWNITQNAYVKFDFFFSFGKRYVSTNHL